MKKTSAFILMLAPFVILGTLFFSTQLEKWTKVDGESCPHTGDIEMYDAFAPTKVKLGQMLHYACCDCHTAWQDTNRTIEIGNTNTIEGRKRIDINYKTENSEISKHNISANNAIVNISTASPYVVGLDQTNWTISNSGVGGGTFNYYNIDGRQAVRISAEDVTFDQYVLLDQVNNGYSSFRVEKTLSGQVTISFSYKIYDLSTSTYGDEARTHVVFEGENGYKEIVPITLDSDNEWHDYTLSTVGKSDFISATFKIHHFKGEMYLANMSVSSTGLQAPVIESVGAGIQFMAVPNAEYYLVHDSNNNPSEIRLEGSESNNGILSYRPTVAGKHNIYVTAHDNDGEYDASKSNVIEDIEVAPVFFYDNFANEYFVDTGSTYYSKATAETSAWTYPDSSNQTGTTRVAYYGKNGFTSNKEERMRFNSTAVDGHLYRIVEEAKELGTNVLLISHRDGYLSGDLTLNTNTELKTIMDYAYENNLKVIPMVDHIYWLSSEGGTSYEQIESSVNDYLNEYALELIQHPAFYGFTLRDEPPNDADHADVRRVAWTAKACIEYFNKNYESKNLALKLPFFVCAFLQQGNGTTYCCDYNYMAYVEEWLDITGLNYYSTDIYTYTTQYYDTYHFNGSNTGEVIDLNYAIYMKLKAKYKGLKMHLVATSNYDKYNTFLKQKCNVYDIFGSTLYAAALNNYGISRYTYYPAIWTYHWQDGVVSRSGAKTSKYNWVKEAQAQFEFIQDKLYGYEPTAISFQTVGGLAGNTWNKRYSIGDYVQGHNFKESTNTRRMDVELTKGDDTVEMIVNYNTQENFTSTFSVAIPSGKAYYLFGNGIATVGHRSIGENVTLSHGQAVLITNEDLSGKNVERLNEMISNANNAPLKTKMGQTQFALLSNEIDEVYSTLSLASKAKIVGYDTYIENKEKVAEHTGVLYDRALTYYDGDLGSVIALNKTEDNTYGEMNSVEFTIAKSVSMQINFDSDLVGEDWSAYKSVGFFARFDAPNNDKTFLHPNNVWGAITATKTLVDSSTNTYYYNFDLSSLDGPFTAITTFEIYFGNTMNVAEVSNIIYSYKFEITSNITAANKGGSGAWGTLDKNNNGEFIWEKAYATMGFASRTYVDPNEFTEVVVTITNTCSSNLYFATWFDKDASDNQNWSRVATDSNAGSTITFSISVSDWNNGRTMYMDGYEIGNDLSSKGSANISYEAVFDPSSKDFTAYNNAIAEMNKLSVNVNSDVAKFIFRYEKVDQLLNELTSEEKTYLQGYDTYIANRDIVINKAGILYNGGYRCANDGLVLSSSADDEFSTLHRLNYNTPIEVNGRELTFVQETLGLDWSYSAMGLFVRYNHAVTDNGVFLPDNNWEYADWGTQSRAPTLIDSSTNLYYYEWPVSYLSAFTNNSSAISFYFAPGGALVSHSYMEVSNIVYFN